MLAGSGPRRDTPRWSVIRGWCRCMTTAPVGPVGPRTCCWHRAHREDHRFRDCLRGGVGIVDPGWDASRHARLSGPGTGRGRLGDGGQRPVFPRCGRLGVPSRGTAVHRHSARDSAGPRGPRNAPLPAAIPGGVADLVAELTAKDPAARPASAASVAARAGQLRAAITGTATITTARGTGRGYATGRLADCRDVRRGVAHSAGKPRAGGVWRPGRPDGHSGRRRPGGSTSRPCAQAAAPGGPAA